MEGAESVEIDRGRRRACLLLHGFASSPADFGQLPHELDRAGWDVHAPLLPGHGTAPGDLATVTAEQILEAAEDQYRRVSGRHDCPAVGGFSMGGTIATALAASHRPRALVLISPYYRVAYRAWYVLPAEWWHRILSPLINEVPAAKAVNQPGAADRLAAYETLPMPAIGELFRVRNRVVESVEPQEVRCPALLVYSEGDEVASPSAMRKAFERLPAEGNAVARFTRSNHHVLQDYDRRAAVWAVVEFLGRAVDEKPAPRRP